MKSFDIVLIKPWFESPLRPNFSRILENLISNLRNSEEVIKWYFFPRKIPTQEIPFYLTASKTIDITNKWPLPYGLLCIASFLEKFGYSAKVVSLDYEKWKLRRNRKNWLRKTLARYVKSTDIVGITCSSPEYEKAIKVLKTVKEIDPDIITVIGGPHSTFLAEKVIQEPYVDIVVRGEGERTTLELISAKEKNEDLKKVRGITFRKDKRIFSTTPQKPLDANEIPVPAYHLLPRRGRKRFVIYTMFSRGCPYNCLNCVETRFWPGIRLRNVNSCIEELKMLEEEFKVQFIHLADSYFFANKSFVQKIYNEILRERINLLISCNTRPDFFKTIPMYFLKKLVAKANFIEFIMGVESGSNKMLRVLNRRHTIEDAQISLKRLIKLPIFIRTNWMVGCPGETHQTVLESIKQMKYMFLKNLIFDAAPRHFVPLPGLEPFYKPSKYGISFRKFAWNECNKALPIHRTEYLSEYEIFSYVLLMHFIRLDHFAKITGKRDKINCVLSNLQLLS